MKKNLSKLLALTLLTTTLFTVQAYAADNVSKINTTATKASSYSTSETLTATSTPITSEYCTISGYAKDSDGNPLANRRVTMATNYNGAPKEHSYIRASETYGTVTTDSNGYYKIDGVIQRSSYLAPYYPGKDCSYYVYLDTGKYSYDEITNYVVNSSSAWPFKWALDSGTLISSDVRTYLYS